jgi:hypothetical protein
MDAETEQRIRGLRSACGCKSGMVGLLTALTAYIVLAAGDAGIVHRVLVGAGVSLGGALVGKVAGLGWARVRLALLLRRLAATTATTASPTSG